MGGTQEEDRRQMTDDGKELARESITITPPRPLTFLTR